MGIGEESVQAVVKKRTTVRIRAANSWILAFFASMCPSYLSETLGSQHATVSHPVGTLVPERRWVHAVHRPNFQTPNLNPTQPNPTLPSAPLPLGPLVPPFPAAPAAAMPLHAAAPLAAAVPLPGHHAAAAAGARTGTNKLKFGNRHLQVCIRAKAHTAIQTTLLGAGTHKQTFGNRAKQAQNGKRHAQAHRPTGVGLGCMNHNIQHASQMEQHAREAVAKLEASC
eukprot:985164-Pelagomonas_calceolata.AAC.3